MKINNRLKKISELIEDNSFILDVGCDHALLDIYLHLNKKNIKTIASDINEKPLEKAKENIKKYNLEDKIIVKCSDGISLLDDNIDTIVISGMGFETILKIIKDNIRKITNQKLIISTNNDEDLLRKKLNILGFKILDEVLIEDKNIIYSIIVFSKKRELLTKKQINYGPILLKNKQDKTYQKYYNKKLNNLINIKNNIPNKYILKRLIINKKIRELKNIL